MNVDAHRVEVREAGGTVEVRVTGKLTRADYEIFVPEIERFIKEYGKIRVLFDMHDFRGWEMAALWEDVKFDARHFSDIEKLALIGEKAWEKGMAVFCRPFTSASIRYFDRTQAEEARKWIRQDG